MATVFANDVLRDLFLLRTVVAAIGERTSPAWWRTQFLTEVGLRTMTRIFPRTGISAAIDSASKAARTEHDTRIGTGRYHLFRLPKPLEESVMHATFGDLAVGELSPLFNAGTETLLSELDSLAKGHGIKSASGPVSLGDSSRLGDPKVVAQLAAHYRASVSVASRCYPYFVSGEERS